MGNAAGKPEMQWLDVLYFLWLIPPQNLKAKAPHNSLKCTHLDSILKKVQPTEGKVKLLVLERIGPRLWVSIRQGFEIQARVLHSFWVLHPKIWSDNQSNTFLYRPPLTSLPGTQSSVQKATLYPPKDHTGSLFEFGFQLLALNNNNNNNKRGPYWLIYEERLRSVVPGMARSQRTLSLTIFWLSSSLNCFISRAHCLYYHGRWQVWV